jgi:hypothetical protein
VTWKLIKDQRIRRLLIVGCVIFAAIILGFALADHYGQSWDDGGNAEYGRLSLQAYVGSSDFLLNAEDRYYGPLHFMVSAITVDYATYFFPNWHPVDVRHYMNYLAFIAGIVALYALTRLFIGKRAGIITTLLFATQPVIFGQAFINQKDIPFMAAFCAAFLLGIRAVDFSRIGERDSGPPLKGVRSFSEISSSIRSDWYAHNIGSRLVFVTLGIIVALFVIDMMTRIVIYPQMEDIVIQAYEGHAWSPIQIVFNRIAQDAHKTPVNLYLDQLQVVYNWIRVPACLIAIALLVAATRKRFPITSRKLNWQWTARHTAFGLAGLALGAATSIRVAAPLAGVFVMLYLFAYLGRRGIGFAFIYWSVAAVFTYLAWPFLWWNPLGHLLETVQIMGNFPSHAVLYQGEILQSNNLPWHFLPNLLGLQLTEPALLLILAGIPISLLKIKNDKSLRLLLFLIMLWISVPLTAVILFNAPIYGNFRQLMFVLPALFVLAGLALEKALIFFRRQYLLVVAVILLLIPGLHGIIRLHPFEYTYYNILIGGESGVAGSYDLDYWCTGYREAIEFVNTNADYGARILVSGPDHLARTFARDDLIIYADWENVHDVDYALACGRIVQEDWFYPDMNVVFSVHRGDAEYAIVKASRK